MRLLLNIIYVAIVIYSPSTYAVQCFKSYSDRDIFFKEYLSDDLPVTKRIRSGFLNDKSESDCQLWMRATDALLTDDKQKIVEYSMDEMYLVRFAVANNYDTPLSIAQRLSTDTDSEVASSAITLASALIDGNFKKPKMTMAKYKRKNWLHLSSSESIYRYLSGNTLFADYSSIDGLKCDSHNCYGILLFLKAEPKPGMYRNYGEFYMADYSRGERIIGEWTAEQGSLLNGYGAIEIKTSGGQWKNMGQIWIDQSQQYVWLNYPNGKVVMRIIKGIDNTLLKDIKSSKWQTATIPKSLSEQLVEFAVTKTVDAVVSSLRESNQVGSSTLKSDTQSSTASTRSAYAGYSSEETSYSTGKVYQYGKLLATLEYFNGWKVLCEHKRISGTPRYQDERRDAAIQRAISECRLN